jgi:CspA family cold shock protein
MPSGTVKWFNMQKGYGFIASDDGGQDVFVHISAVLGAGLPELREGQMIEFEIEPARNGKMAATNLKLR